MHQYKFGFTVIIIHVSAMTKMKFSKHMIFNVMNKLEALLTNILKSFYD